MMKKLMTAFAVCVFAGLGSAQIESQNIVGYNSVTIEKKWTIMAVNFENVSGGAISLQDAVPYAEGMTKGNNIANADNIQIQTAAGGYDVYYMSNGLNAKSQVVQGLEGKWALMAKYEPTTAVIPAGKGAWYLRRGTTDFDITIARPFDL